MLKKKDMKGQPASMVDMFARLSCAEGTTSVFEPPDGHYLELEQVGAYCIFTHTSIFLHIQCWCFLCITHTHPYFFIHLYFFVY
jgi:hypothetical protein